MKTITLRDLDASLLNSMKEALGLTERRRMGEWKMEASLLYMLVNETTPFELELTWLKRSSTGL